MKKHGRLIGWGALAAIGLLGAVALTGSGSAARKEKVSSPIAWQTSLQSAEKVSRQTGKPVFVIFHADWCGACKVLEQKVLPTPEVSTQAQNWVMVRVNVDKEKEIAAKYRISSLPTLGFYKASGGPKYGMEGAPGATELVDLMKRAEAKLAEPNTGAA